MNEMTAEKLWVWASAYARRAEKTGKGTQYPTFRQATKRFHCTLDDIEDIIGDDPGADERYLGITTYYSFEASRGDYWLVEAY